MLEFSNIHVVRTFLNFLHCLESGVLLWKYLFGEPSSSLTNALPGNGSLMSGGYAGRQVCV